MTINELMREVFKVSEEHGFWLLRDINSIPRAIALIHSELSEALEESREMVFDPAKIFFTDSNKPLGFPIELADAIIRILDLAGALGIDMEEAIRLKHEYNKTRPHMHGKRF